MKLVRDRIPEIIRRSGEEPVVVFLDEMAGRRALLDKVFEEAHELARAEGAAILDELCDLYELVGTVAAASGLTLEAVIERAATKRAEWGGFARRAWLVGGATAGET